MTAVQFVAPFPAWQRVLDLRLLEHTGRVLGDLPIPEYVAWEWYARGFTARDVAERLVDRAAKVPKTTAVRFYMDEPIVNLFEGKGNERKRQV